LLAAWGVAQDRFLVGISEKLKDSLGVTPGSHYERLKVQGYGKAANWTIKSMELDDDVDSLQRARFRQSTGSQGVNKRLILSVP